MDSLSRPRIFKSELQSAIVKQEPIYRENKSVAEDTLKVERVASDGAQMRMCDNCSFLGLPKKLRLHQLFGCLSSVPDSVQKPQLSDNTLEKERVASDGAQMRMCDFCSFLGLPKRQRLHRLLGCHLSVPDSIQKPQIADSSEAKIQLPLFNTTCDVAPSFALSNTRPLPKLQRISTVTQGVKNSRQSDQKSINFTHNGEKQYRCDLCEYKCFYLSDLKRHKHLSHTRGDNFTCDECGFKFCYWYLLKRHALKHKKPVDCKFCGCKCYGENDLKTHMLMHAGEKKFNCNLCSFKCNSVGSIKRHNMIHTGEKPFTCNVCSNKFREASGLKRHMLTHTGK